VAGRVFNDDYLLARNFAWDKASELRMCIPIEKIEVTTAGPQWQVLRYITPDAAPRPASYVRETSADSQMELARV
jgi:hypothetical protein